MFSLPVTDTAGLRLMEDEAQPEAALQTQQKIDPDIPHLSPKGLINAEFFVIIVEDISTINKGR